jgi:biopolymer transport protein ExbD
MAELNTGGGGDKGGKVRSKKSNPGVDLTAMVDLAFLLITFFILTTTLSKPQSMNMNLPDNSLPPDDPNSPPIPGWRTMTIVLGKNNQLLYYIGQTGSYEVGGEPKVEKYGGQGIRKAVLKQKDYVASLVSDPAKEGLNVLIKVSKAANYTNVVDILDEMSITSPKYYSLIEMTDADTKLLADKGIK